MGSFGSSEGVEVGDSLQSWWCGSLFALTRSECCATIRLRPAAYPSGLRGRIANPLFVGSNPTAAFTLSSATPSAARCFASWPRCVPGGARSAASAGRPPGRWRPGRKFHRGLYARTARRLSGGALSRFMATVRPGRCPVRGVRVRGRLGFGAEKGRNGGLNATCS